MNSILKAEIMHVSMLNLKQFIHSFLASQFQLLISSSSFLLPSFSSGPQAEVAPVPGTHWNKYHCNIKVFPFLVTTELPE